ncbi:MAG: DMT family transporter [Oligoflexus sp.]|nr:DMT family transporter [Oligoflexus sp.]
MLGIVIALLCAVVWSCAVILLKFSGARMHPLALNLVKSLLGLPLLIATCYFFEGGIQWPKAWQHSVMLLVSGGIGIGIADGIVLHSMRYLRASHIAILECLFSPFVIILSVLFFDERPTPMMLVGGVFIIASLLFLKPEPREEEPGEETNGGTKLNLKRGSLFMGLGLFMMAGGIVMVKPLFAGTPLFSLVTIRMIGGVLTAFVMFLRIPYRGQQFREVFRTPHKVQLLGACFLSSYLSIILWIAGYKYLQATIAALLNQTSTVFTVLLAVIFLKEKITTGKVLATVSAIIGIILLTV